MIIIFSLAPTSGLYWAYRGAQWRVAEDARHTEKLRMERSYQIMEWTYDCTALDAEGQTFAYGIFCHSYAMQSNLSLYKDVDCKTSLGANPTDEEVILTLEVRAVVKNTSMARHGQELGTDLSGYMTGSRSWDSEALA